MLPAYLGVLFASFAVFFFELVCANFLGFTLGSGYVLIVLPLAMIGVAAAGSVMACFRIDSQRVVRVGWKVGSCFLLAMSFLSVPLVNYLLKARLNGHFAGSFDGYAQAVASVFPVIAVAMFIPYAIFGALIAGVFRECQGRAFNSVYFADLAGGALGCVIAYVVLDQGWFKASIVLPSIIALAAAIAFAVQSGASRRTLVGVAFAAITIIAVTFPALGRIEPAPNLDVLARNWDRSNKIKEIWSGWNSYSRVGAVEVLSPDGHQSHKLMLGNGEGQATLHTFDPADPAVIGQITSAHLSLLFNPAPENVLVLMAGAGADMLAIDKLTRGRTRITGVELNNRVAQAALALEQFNLREFFSRPGIQYVVDEARSFLERDTTKYDVILSSFSGATTAYFAGSMGQTTQFVYTTEAMRSMISRLRDQGYLVLLNTNKVRLLANVREALGPGHTPSPDRTAIVLGIPGSRTSHVFSGWDENRLLVKPAGFSDAEVADVVARAKTLGYEALYAPGLGAYPGYEAYESVLLADDPTQLSFGAFNASAVYDDRPFIFDVRAPQVWLDQRFLLQVFDSVSRNRDPELRRLAIALVIAILGVILIVGPLLMRGGIRIGKPAANHLAYFSALGGGFMLVEIGLVHKLGLLMGDPGLTLAIVLGGIVLFAGIGSLTSRVSVRESWLALNVMSLIGILAGFIAFGDFLIRAVLPYGPLVRAAFSLMSVALPAFIMGRFMPYGLRVCQSDDARLVSWCWAVNGAAGTLVACLGPLAAQLFGFKSLLVAGACSYVVIALLPRYRRFSSAVATDDAAAAGAVPAGYGGVSACRTT